MGALEKNESGIPGLDTLLGGGWPAGRTTLLIGGVGTGKTVLALQTLTHHVRNLGQPALFTSFEESADQLEANVAGFSWGHRDDDDGPMLVDAALPSAVIDSGAFDLEGLLGMLAARAEARGARHVALDGIDMLVDLLRDRELVQRELTRIREWGRRHGLSVILTAKMMGGEAGLRYESLEYVADCVLRLRHYMVGRNAQRSIRVTKYRGSSHSTNEQFVRHRW